MERLTTRSSGPLPVLVRGKAFGPAYFRSEHDYEDYRDALNKLAAYEDAEEQGRLLVLPCKVGDILWDTESLTESPSRHIVLGFDVLKSLNMVHLSGGQSLPVSEIGKTVFLTRAEAEKALEGKNNA